MPVCRESEARLTLRECNWREASGAPLHLDWRLPVELPTPSPRSSRAPGRHPPPAGPLARSVRVVPRPHSPVRPRHQPWSESRIAVQQAPAAQSPAAAVEPASAIRGRYDGASGPARGSADSSEPVGRPVRPARWPGPTQSGGIRAAPDPVNPGQRSRALLAIRSTSLPPSRRASDRSGPTDPRPRKRRWWRSTRGSSGPDPAPRPPLAGPTVAIVPAIRRGRRRPSRHPYPPACGGGSRPAQRPGPLPRRPA